MSVKIVTYHSAHNYGALLQCASLYRTLKSMDNDTAVYDYVSPKIADSYKLIKHSKGLKGKAAQVLTLPVKLRKKILFEKFLNKNIDLSKDYDENDIFITGSDQVWNYRATDFDKTYFLDFVKDNKNKNSYAASFGISSIEAEYVPEYKRLLENFNNISVREDTGEKIVKEICGKDAEVMPDPVFLTTVDEWKKLAKPKRNKKEYILMYLMVKTPTAIAFAKKLSDKTGLPVYFIDNYAMNLPKCFKVKRGQGPAEFLSLFAGCKYVVTNSFHGTAFSIMFNKKMYVELLPEQYGVNSRIHNVLNCYDLFDRIINEKMPEDINEDIDFSKINEKIETERARGIEYLKKIVKGEF